MGQNWISSECECGELILVIPSHNLAVLRASRALVISRLFPKLLPKLPLKLQTPPVATFFYIYIYIHCRRLHAYPMSG